jgi:hypothetical protein
MKRNSSNFPDFCFNRALYFETLLANAQGVHRFWKTSYENTEGAHILSV